MFLGVTRRIATAGVLTIAAGLLATVTAVGVAGASQPPRAAGPQQRQIAVAQLTWFKVVLTATRGPGQPPSATVTAAGYRRSATGWRLISVQRIGARNSWFWFAVDTCSLRTTQYRPGSPVQRVDSVRLALLATPALGCTKPVSLRWKP
jgi:hypothetical protein